MNTPRKKNGEFTPIVIVPEFEIEAAVKKAEVLPREVTEPFVVSVPFGVTSKEAPYATAMAFISTVLLITG